MKSIGCTYCGRSQSKVVVTRQTARGVTRRRECLNQDCRWRWTTCEVRKEDLADLKKVASQLCGRGGQGVLAPAQ